MALKFPQNLKEARQYQKNLIEKIDLNDRFSRIDKVGGLDVAYKEGRAYAAGVIYDIKTEKVYEKKSVIDKVTVPYVPTFLFLREVPTFLKVLKKLQITPDIFLVDGHGIAHPYYAGSATVFSMTTGIPTIGVAKKPLRTFTYEPTQKPQVDIIYVKGRKVGFRYKTNPRWNPIYISPGNKISLSSALSIVDSLLDTKHKLPNPLYLAHKAAEESKHTEFQSL
ncbi:MAG: endonuclease V [Candidatus Heimdallarchaeaceae archaeon]